MNYDQLNEKLMGARTGLTEAKTVVVTITSFDGVEGGDTEEYTGTAGGKEYLLWYPEVPNPKMSRYVKGDKVKVTDLDGTDPISGRIVKRA